MKMIRQWIFFFYLFFTPLFAYKYDLSVCAIFQNEARFLKEWIEFHQLVGVQHFILFNNFSTDNYLEVLDPYVREGIVELIEFPYESNNQIEFNAVQMQAYDQGITLSKGISRWVAFIDTDEFLFPAKGSNLVGLLKEYREYGGLEVNWQVFGTSGVNKIPENKLMIKSLILKGDPNMQMNHNTKSIVQPHLVKRCTGAHNFAYRRPYYSVYSNYEPSSQNPISPYVLIDKIRINHYWTRDEKFLCQVKGPRYIQWAGNHGYIHQMLPQLNAVKDKKILRFARRLNRAVKSRSLQQFQQTF